MRGVVAFPRHGLHERPATVHRNTVTLVMYSFGVSIRAQIM